MDIPDTIIDLKGWTFLNCSNLGSVDLKENLKSIGWSTFQGTGLTNVIIPSTVTDISTYAFYNCSKLTRVEIKSTKLDSLGQGFITFCPIESLIINPACKELKWADKPIDKNNNKVLLMYNNKIVYIDNNYLNTSTSFDIPEGITEFDINLPGNIKTISIPSSLTSISAAMLPNLNDITVNNNTKYKTLNDTKNHKILFSINEEKKLKLEYFCATADSDISIPSTIKDTSGKEWEIDEIESCSLRTLAQSKSVTINANKIDRIIFDWNTKGNSIIIGENVKTINENAFGGGDDVKVSVDPQNSIFYADNGILYEKTESTYKLKRVWDISSWNVNETITLPKEVKNTKVDVIGFYALYGKKVKSIVIPDSVIKIEGRAFNSCSDLETIIIPSSVTVIGGSCFEGCNKLEANLNNGQGGIRINKKEGTIAGAPWGATKGDRAVKWLQ